MNSQGTFTFVSYGFCVCMRKIFFSFSVCSFLPCEKSFSFCYLCDAFTSICTNVRFKWRRKTSHTTFKDEHNFFFLFIFVFDSVRNGHSLQSYAIIIEIQFGAVFACLLHVQSHLLCHFEVAWKVCLTKNKNPER